MSLEKSIVVINEFTTKKNPSRGGTPKKYIKDYMARDDATDRLYPIISPLEGAEAIVRNRMQAIDVLKEAKDEFDSPQLLQAKKNRVEKANGVAFGSKGLTYSDDELEEEAEKVKQCFDSGHTVMKTILSFQTDYLKEYGILPENFSHNRMGDFDGQLDQLKLRYAVNEGLDEMTKSTGFGKPLWVATVQCDTNHVHVHLAMTDEGDSSRRVSNGEERGKFSALELSLLRRGCHRSFEQNKDLKHMHQQVEIEQKLDLNQQQSLSMHNALANLYLQRLIASLPKDKKKWEYENEDELMVYPNQLMDGYIKHLEQAHSGKTDVDEKKRAIDAYASYMTASNRWTAQEGQQYKQQAKQQAHSQIANTLYEDLRKSQAVQPRNLKISNPTIETQATPPSEIIQQMKKEETPKEISTFHVKASLYQKHLGEHMKEANNYFKAINDFEERDNGTSKFSGADSMKHFYETESVHHMKLVDKYRSLIPANAIVKADLDPIDFYIPKNEGERLNAVKKQLEDEMGKHELNPQEAIKKQVEAILDADRAGEFNQVMGGVIYKDDVPLEKSVAEVLEIYAEDETMATLPIETLRAVKAIEPLNYEVKNAKENLEKWGQLRAEQVNDNDGIEDNEKTSTIRAYPKHVEDQINTYTTDLYQYKFKQFANGRLTAEDVGTMSSMEETIKDTGELPSVPDLKSPYHLLKESDSAYVKQVRSLDLSDVKDDLLPFEHRNVGATHAKRYNDSCTERVDAVDNAVNYLERTNQQQLAMLQIQQRIHIEKMNADFIEETGQLPQKIEPTTADDTPSPSDGRQLRTITFDSSQRLTQKNLQKVKMLNGEVSTEVKQQLVVEQSFEDNITNEREQTVQAPTPADSEKAKHEAELEL